MNSNLKFDDESKKPIEKDQIGFFGVVN
jgi:hypothetical protein